MKSPFLALLLSLSPSFAALIGGVDFGDTRAEVTKKLAESSDMSAIDDAPQASKLQRSHQMIDRVAHQDWVVSFEFANNGKKLIAIHVDGEEGIPVDMFDAEVKSFYLYVTNAVKDAYGIDPDGSENTPRYHLASELHQGKRYPMHIYDFNGLRLMMTLRMDLNTKLVYVGYTLLPAPEDTAMGSTELPNNKGDASDWMDIPTWESLKYAEEFLYKNGLKERPKPVEKVEKVEESEGSNEGGTQPEEKPKDLVPDYFKKIDPTLPDSEKALLKGLILDERGELEQAALFFAEAARQDDGNGRAFYQLALCFELGQGLPQDIDRAASAYLKAAQLGYAPALVRFGAEYKIAIEELGLTADEAKAILDTAHQLAADNSVWGRFNLAMFYRYGYGLRKDVAKARALFSPLAQQGDPSAIKELENCPKAPAVAEGVAPAEKEAVAEPTEVEPVKEAEPAEEAEPTVEAESADLPETTEAP